MDFCSIASGSSGNCIFVGTERTSVLIDAGISGRTAQMVSEKMNVIGKSHQVICITHLPQIAAMADVHFLIEKSVVGENTVSRIRPLEKEESVAELARMIGGVAITDTVLKSAREMKELALHEKK